MEAFGGCFVKLPSIDSARFSCCLLSAVLVFSSVGCSQEEKKRNYSVPEQLCGLDVGGKLAEPFMPPGDRVHQAEEGGGVSIWHCDISVDDKAVFQMAREWWKPGWSARRFAPSQAYVEPEHEAADESYVYSDEGAVAALRCTEEGNDWDLFLVARVRDAGVPDEKAMGRFITAYRAEVLKTDPCAEE